MTKAEKAVLGTWRITSMEVWDADANALQGILQHGEQQLAQGKVKPLAEVVTRLRRVK
jgi:hypothetical protein